MGTLALVLFVAPVVLLLFLVASAVVVALVSGPERSKRAREVLGDLLVFLRPGSRR